MLTLLTGRFRPTLAHAHTNPAYRQHAFRFRTVNPTTAAANAAFDASDPALNTNITPTLTANYPFRLRFEVEETAGGGGSITPTLWVSVNGGAYSQVGSASSVVRSLAASFADGAATTNVVSSSARTFLVGWVDDVDATGASITYTGNQHTELDFSLEIVNADVTNSDTLDFQVRDGNSTLGTYGVTPRITVTKPSATVTQEAFRVRLDSAALNTDAGWSAAQDTNVALEAEQTIRLRFRVKATNAGVNQGYQLRYSRNGGAYTALPVQATPVDPGITPAVIESTISGQFADGDAITAALLTGGTGTFVNGSADEASNSVAAINLGADQYTEVEFAVRIRKLYWDGAAVAENIDGTTFDFRLYTAGGVALTAYTATPRVTVDSAGLVGGCWPEAPHFMGPIIDSNGAMYFFMESWELKTNGGWVVAMKSTDGGLTWAAQDIADGPGATAGNDDWEGASIVKDNQVQGRVFLFSHHSTSVQMHTFFMSDHATTPDQWGTVGTVVGTFTSVLNSMQWVAAAQRSDGDLILLYNTADATDNRTEYRVSTDAGANWSGPTSLDATAGESIYNAWPVMGESDLCYIFYHVNTAPTDDAAQVYYKTLSSADVLSGRTQVSTNALAGGVGERGAILGGGYYDDGGVEVVTIAWVDSLQATPVAVARSLRDGSLQSIETVSGVAVVDGGSSGSNQFVGALAVHGSAKTLHVLYADTAHDVWHDSEVADGGWGTDTELEDAVDALWVRANVVVRAGTPYLTYVYDNGTGTTGGGQGPVYHGEMTLSAAVSISLTPAVVTTSARALSVVAGALAESLTPASLAISAQVLSPTPAGLAVALTPASASLSAQALSPTLAPLATPITAASIALSASVLSPQVAAGAIEIPLTPATTSLTASALTPVLAGAVTPLTPATTSLSAQALSPVLAVINTLTPATITSSAGVMSVVPGLLSTPLTPASLVISARVLSPQVSGTPVSVTLTPAIITTAASGLALSLGAYSTSLAPATVASSASALALNLSPLSIPLAPVSLAITAQALSPAIATVIALSPATIVIEASPMPPTVPGMPVVVALAPVTLNIVPMALSVNLGAVVASLTPAVLLISPATLAVVVGPHSFTLMPATITISPSILTVINGDPIIPIGTGPGRVYVSGSRSTSAVHRIYTSTTRRTHG